MRARKREVSPLIFAQELLRLLRFLLDPHQMARISRELLQRLWIDLEAVLDQVVRNMELPEPRDRIRHKVLREGAASLVFSGEVR